MNKTVTDTSTSIHLTISEAALLTALVLVPLFVMLVAAFRKRKHNAAKSQPDWSIPAIDAYAGTASFFHDWHPAAKVVSLLAYCFLLASLKSPACSTVALAASLIAVQMSRLPWRRSLQRLAAMSGFLLMFLVIVPFTSHPLSGETRILFPLLEGFPFRLHGFLLALNVAIKACAIALMMEPMFGTSPLSLTLHALNRLGLPASVSQMILISHRYIFVFQQEIIRMWRSMRVRGFTAGSDISTMKTMGNFFGMLFISSFDRTEKVYEAMRCRGYSGALPSHSCREAGARDWLKGVGWVAFGLLLLVGEYLHLH